MRGATTSSFVTVRHELLLLLLLLHDLDAPPVLPPDTRLVFLIFLPARGETISVSCFSTVRLRVMIYFLMTLPLMGSTGTSCSRIGFTT